MCESEGTQLGCVRLVGPADVRQELRMNCLEQVVTIEAARQRTDLVQGDVRTHHLPQGNGTVQPLEGDR
jgi:hypothetical protein